MTKLDELIKCLSSDHVYIQTHNFPDPDAIGSGYGLQYLLGLRGIRATLCYGGEIDRYSTHKMIELFDIDIVNVAELGNIMPSEQIILVDTQNVDENVRMTGGTIIGCIDHHMLCRDIEYCFCDIREKIGACTSIVASYFYDSGTEVPKNVAEALLYGIDIDTANLTRGVTKLDIDMFYRLYMQADHDKISYLENNTIQVEDLNAYAQAISSIRICGNVCFADAGRDCTKSLVAAISDFTLKVAGVSFSVVYSVKSDGIRMSVRSSDRMLHSGRIVIETLRDIGSGGGHSTMAGGFIPFEGQDGAEQKKMLKRIKDRMLEVIVKCIEKEKPVR